jgi:hypothetical protein
MIEIHWVGEWNNGHWAHISSKHAQSVYLFPALVVGHVDHALVAASVADMSQANAGVASSALNNNPTSLDGT